MITFAKGVTSGYLPLGGVLVGRPGARAVLGRADRGAIFRHGYTYSGHATACAAALANLDILERERLVERVAVAGAGAGPRDRPGSTRRRWSARRGPSG